MRPDLAERVLLATRRRGREAAVLVLSALAVGLWALRRRWLPGGFPYLPNNLVLAWIPWLLGLAAVRARTQVTFVALLPAWLLFLPNAPYLVTDLLHLRARAPVPVWYDALLYGAFAIAGSALGWTSLSMVRERFAARVGEIRAELAAAAVSVLTGFGIYLGRFGRWNSWDAWQRPRALLEGAADSISVRAAAFSLLFGVFVWAGCLMVTRVEARRGGVLR
jgi:uncharacterized membrane protein